MSANCTVCQKPKASIECGLCLQAVCKNCVEKLDDASFSFLRKIPADLTHKIYCGRCFDHTVVPARESYALTMRRAKQVFVFWSNKGEETRFYSRAEKPLRVEDCADPDETVMRLAFTAVEDGFNGLIDVKVTSKKVRHHAYQTTRCSGVGTPTTVDAEKLEREQPKK